MAKALCHARLSDECCCGIDKIEQLVRYLGRSRYRKAVGLVDGVGQACLTLAAVGVAGCSHHIGEGRVVKRMYVGANPGLSGGQLVRCLFHPKPALGIPLHICGSGSHALQLALGMLGIGAGESVLVPDFICWVVPRAIGSTGVAVRYYPVDPWTFAPRWDTLQTIAAGSRAAVVVHYFGFPQDLDRWLDLGKAHHLKIIEDCAHALGSTWNGTYLGTVGDCGIFSLRKSLPCPVGGGVYRGSLEPPSGRTGINLLAVEAWTKQGLIWTSHVVGANVHKVLKQPVGPPPDGRPSVGPGIAGVEWLLRTAGTGWAERRRTNYLRLARSIGAGAPNAVLRELEPGVVPCGLPLLAEDEDTAARLIGARVGAYRWPPLPDEVRSADPALAGFARRLILLPVHQSMAARHLRFVADQVVGIVGKR